ncbi:MAG: SWIM zinc finger family protein [Bacteroidetes bacterium]|nr:SWIM zinc finger family protein [Bacteroidota bacterium]MCB0847088.1 SWIM zinc finger family protein [Bacteroidota bacterium]MCB0855200.1 SWIM zinc finger family protein [Bacteroidota bacterium]
MNISEEFLQNHSLPQVFERGMKAHQDGWEGKIEKHGPVFLAETHSGNLYNQVIYTESDEIRANCSCPYDDAGLCKHLVAVGLGILNNRFDVLSNELDPELAKNLDLVNIKQLRNSFTRDNIPVLQAEMEEYLEQDNFRNAMRILLGVYEGWQKEKLSNPASELSENPAEQLLSSVMKMLEVSPIDQKQQIALLATIFKRWDKYEQTLDLNSPEKSIRYDLNLFEDFMMVLAENPAPAQFLRMRVEGYSLAAHLLPQLREVLDRPGLIPKSDRKESYES